MRVESVAVARFESSQSEEPWGFGFAVLLAEHLRRVNALRVVPARQSLADAEERTAEEIGRRSGVDGVLTGTLDTGGHALELTAIVVDPLSERELWQERYSVHCHDVLHVVRGIAERVTAAIGCEAAFRARPAASSRYAWDAFRAYASARWLDWFGGDDALPRAARLYERAAVLAPSLLAANAARAFAVLALIAGGREERSRLDGAAHAAFLALRADPSLPEASAATGLAHFLRGDARRAAVHLRRAARLDPFSVRIHRALAAVDPAQPLHIAFTETPSANPLPRAIPSS